MAKGPRYPSLTPDRIDQVWDKGKPIPGKDRDLYRRDVYGNEMYKPSLGKQGDKSWEVDHIRPKAKGGSENLRNLQPLQTETNREKGDRYPFKPRSSSQSDRAPRTKRPGVRWI